MARQIPALLRKGRFDKIDIEVICVHSLLEGDRPFLKAENVNISKSLVREGFLEKDTLESLIENWYKMLQHPDHAIFRQLFIVNGEKEEVDVADYHNSKAEELTDTSGRTQIPANLKDLTSAQQDSTLVIYFIKRISEIMEQPDLDPEPDTKLNDIDIDSIAAAELSSLLKSDFNTVVSIADILQKFSINDIVRAVMNNPDSFKSGTSERELPESDNKWLEGEL